MHLEHEFCWFNLCLLSGEYVVAVSVDWSVPRRESLQSQWAEQIGDYLSGTEQCGQPGQPWPPGPGDIAGPGPSGDPGPARLSSPPAPAPPLRKYDLWQPWARAAQCELGPITRLGPGQQGGGRGLWLNSSYSPQNELCQVCKTEIPHSPQGLSGVPNNWLVDNYGSYKDYPRFIWIKKGISG